MTWKELDCLQTNAQIMAYSLFITPVGGQRNTFLLLEPQVRLNINPNQVYSFQVAALNSNGVGPYSPIVRVIPASAPTGMSIMNS